jgi:hypothetical protein
MYFFMTKGRFMPRAHFIAILSLFVLLFASASYIRADVGGCAVFPADNYWNRDISAEPVHPQSAAIIANINSNGGDFVHPDFGGEIDDWYGIPWITVTNAQEALTKRDNPSDLAGDITFDYADESGEGPYPIPYNAPIEGGPGADGDRHVIVINTDTCVLSELYAAEYTGGAGGNPNTWNAGSGAIFDLNSNDRWPDGWTSADAAGLPIFPGLARCDEVMSGEINHAFRFTVSRTRNMYIYPASHEASNYDGALYPPMGMRVRLKADYDISSFGPQAAAIASAMKRYGMILADNGSNWFFSGEYNPNCWDDDDLNDLKRIPGTAFEVLAYPGEAGPALPHFADTTPTLQWSPVTWAVEYELDVARTANFAAPLVFETTVATTSATISPALSEGTYYWRVRARDAAGKYGNWSTPASFVIAIIS